jgi:hypothetical protein
VSVRACARRGTVASNGGINIDRHRNEVARKRRIYLVE